MGVFYSGFEGGQPLLPDLIVMDLLACGDYVAQQQDFTFGKALCRTNEQIKYP